MELTVNVIKAILTHDTEIGSKMDPFVVLKLGSQQQKSETLQQEGDMPQFNFKARFSVQSDEQKLHLIVYDEDVTTNDLVGEAIIDLRPILTQPFTKQKWYSLTYIKEVQTKKNQKPVPPKLAPAGKVMIEFTCKRTGNSNDFMKAKVNPAIYAPQHIGSGKLYGVEKEIHLSSHSPRSVGKNGVYSFRNQTVRHGSGQLLSPQSGHILSPQIRGPVSRSQFMSPQIQNGISTLYSSGHAVNNNDLSSKSTSGYFIPVHSNSSIYYPGYSSSQTHINILQNQRPQRPVNIAQSQTHLTQTNNILHQVNNQPQSHYFSKSQNQEFR